MPHVVSSANAFFFASGEVSLTVALPFSTTYAEQSFGSLLAFDFVVVHFVICGFYRIFVTVISYPTTFNTVSLSTF